MDYLTNLFHNLTLQYVIITYNINPNFKMKPRKIILHTNIFYKLFTKDNFYNILHKNRA